MEKMALGGLLCVIGFGIFQFVANGVIHGLYGAITAGIGLGTYHYSVRKYC